MQAWIALAIAAAAFQTLRFALQKTLSMGTLSAAGATFARFFYAVPFAFAFCWAVLGGQGAPWPSLSGWFWAYALAGGLAQILATLCVVLIFQSRNFAVGITFKKTEVIQTALVGLLVLGDHVSLPAHAGHSGGSCRRVDPFRPARRARAGGCTAWPIARRRWGFCPGAFFAVSAVAYRGATLQIASESALLRAAVALAVVSLSQTLAMGLWLRWREPGELSRVWAARRKAVWMGLTSMAGSLSWFTAFTLKSAAYVFAVGQIEVVFSLLVSVLFFREKITLRELWGIGLLTASILLLVALG